VPLHRPAARCVLALLLFAALGLYSAQALRIEADFSAFLPPSVTPEERLLVAQLREGLVARLMLVALHGGDEKALAQASRGLAARLARSITPPTAAPPSSPHRARC
jgi:predicted exporter